MKKKEECLICGQPLVYHKKAIAMKCSICNKEYVSNGECVAHHYVCDECHSKRSLDVALTRCMASDSVNPVDIMNMLMSHDTVHMHGPEHHVLVGCALLTAYHNSNGEVHLKTALTEMKERGSKVPGGICGFWGSCGAAIGAGIFLSIITGSTPLAVEPWRLSNLMTSAALAAIGDIGGPRCCKRNSLTAIKTAADFVKANIGVHMEVPEEIYCGFSERNAQCIGERCPFYRES